MGNRRSVEKAFERVGGEPRLTSDPDVLAAADGLVVPGVGAFPEAMRRLRASGLDELVRERAAAGVPVIGLVPGDAAALRALRRARRRHGLGLLPGEVVRLDARGLKLPHIGWNVVTLAAPVAADRRPRRERRPSTTSTPTSPCPPTRTSSSAPASTVRRSSPFVGRDSVFGAQFHPEKSSTRRPGPPAQLREHRTPEPRSRDPLPRDRHLRGQGRAPSSRAASTTSPSTRTTRSRPRARGCDAGARFLHVVDLDGARHGRPQPAPPRAHHARAADPGPVRRRPALAAAVRDALRAGADRVIIGTAAYTDVDFLDDVVAAFGDRVLVSVDTRGGLIATAGWTHTTQMPAEAVIERLQDRGVTQFIYTNVDRDGMLEGPDLEEVKRIADGRARALPVLRRHRAARRPRGAGRAAPGEPRAASSSARRSTRGASRSPRRRPRSKSASGCTSSA